MLKHLAIAGALTLAFLAGVWLTPLIAAIPFLGWDVYTVLCR